MESNFSKEKLMEMFKTHKLIRDKIPEISKLPPERFVQVDEATQSGFLMLKMEEELREYQDAVTKYAQNPTIENAHHVVEELGDLHAVVQRQISIINNMAEMDIFFPLFSRKYQKYGGFEDGWLLEK